MLLRLYDLPIWEMVALITGAFLLVNFLGSIFIRPFLRLIVRNQYGANDLISYLLGAHGVYFGILLGLLSLAAYENFNKAETQVTQEAASLSGLYRVFSGYPEPARAELRQLLREYARSVISEDWPAQRRREIPRGGTELVTRIQTVLYAFEPKTAGQELLHGQALTSFNDLRDFRRLRLYSVTSGIPQLLWYVVLIGAITSMVLFWMLDMKFLPHLLLGGISNFFLATLIAFVVAMDNPFLGEVSISSSPFEQIYDQLMVPQAPESPRSEPAQSEPAQSEPAAAAGEPTTDKPATAGTAIEEPKANEGAAASPPATDATSEKSATAASDAKQE
ncbi:MAG: hypothetical protein RI963_1585 [Planctomycetota bacterium]|jgi:hypothetical protein